MVDFVALDIGVLGLGTSVSLLSLIVAQYFYSSPLTSREPNVSSSCSMRSASIFFVAVYMTMHNEVPYVDNRRRIVGETSAEVLYIRRVLKKVIHSFETAFF